MKLQIYLSHNGVASRRKSMQMVFDGLVKVNGVVVLEPSIIINPQSDVIEVAGSVVKQQRYELVMLHKPAGFVTTKSRFANQRSVMELLPKEMQHLNPIGRLDQDTEGLLLLTNDGALANQLTHPNFSCAKEYLVHVDGVLMEITRKKLENGIHIKSGLTRPCSITDVKMMDGGTVFHITINEGRKRQIRYMLQAVRLNVTYLKRIRFANLVLGDLKIGQWNRINFNALRISK